MKPLFIPLKTEYFEAFANESGQTLRLFRFHGRDLLDIVNPGAKEPTP